MMKAFLGVGLAAGVLMVSACTENVSVKSPPELLSAEVPKKQASAEGSHERAPDGGIVGRTISSDRASSRVTVRDTWLELRDCELVYGVSAESSSIRMQLPSPCQFAKRKDGSIRIIESENGSVLLVESSRSVLTPAPSGAAVDCDTHLRGVIVTDKGVQLSRDIQKVSTCAPALWDEKMFHIFALQPVAPSEH